jgi:outer membrane biogenesis lipoprotein LolB
MKQVIIAVLSLSVAALFGCSSPQDRAYEAQEKVHEERLDLIDQYQACLKDAGNDPVKTESCDQYLKAAEALK